MGEHSEVCGGSSAGRYINCIGSTDLAKRAPRDTGSIYTRLGTALHFLVEEILGSDEIIDPLDLVGDDVELDGEDADADGNPILIEITEELALTKVIPAIEWFDNVLNPQDYWLEQKVEFGGPLAGAFGTVDVLFFDGHRAGAADWKFGDGVPVSAVDNDQGRFYLAAALHVPWWYELTKHLDEFEFYIVQPVEGAEEIYTRAVYTRDELLDFTTRLIEARQRKADGDKTLTCGKWCKFCPAEMICPAWRDRGKDAIAELQKVEVEPDTYKSGAKKGQPKPVKPKQQVAATLDEYSQQELAQFYMEAAEIAVWAEAVKKYVKTCLENGESIEGLKRVVYQSERHWSDEKKAQNWVRRQGLKAEDYFEPKRLKSVAKIEKLLGKGSIKDGLVNLTPSGYSVVGVDDPRPAVGSNAPDDNSMSEQLAESLAGNNK